MRKFLIIIKFISISLAILCLFVWLLAHGSGHAIPLKTDLKFGSTNCILLITTLVATAKIKRLK